VPVRSVVAAELVVIVDWLMTTNDKAYFRLGYLFERRNVHRLTSEELDGPSAVIAPAETEAMVFLWKKALAC
jgi:hypothetical protein